MRVLTKQLNNDETQALKAVTHGGDVYGYKTARILRELEKRGLVSITKALFAPSGEKQQPYFGAITTKAGRAAIARSEGR